MKKLISSVVLTLLAAGAAPALAGQIRVNTNSFGTTDGGEFIVTVLEGFANYNVGDVFRSFCLEENESIGNNVEFFVEVNDSAVMGGLGGGSPDPLDPRSAYLFRTYGPTVASDADADALQLAIWQIEEEGATADPAALALIADADAWLLAHPGAGLQGVAVLNLWKNRDAAGNLSGARQDILVIIPAPAALALGALGLGTLLRRRALA